jgi:hypothetical protein
VHRGNVIVRLAGRQAARQDTSEMGVSALNQLS